MPLNVMIVDDEKDIHTYLKQIIDWEERDLCLVCEAEDSISASELFALHQPQIVFMDVCIPNFEGRTGLDLAREFCTVNRDVRVIIITGYADFEYAQQALVVGAIDILLKPLQPEEVGKSLDKAVGFYDKKRQMLLSQTAVQQLICENIDLLRRRKIASLLDSSGEISDSQIKEQLRLLGLDIFNEKYAMTHILLDARQELASAEDPQIYTLIVKHMCEQALAENGFKFCTDLPEQNVIQCLVSWSVDGGNDCLELLLNKLVRDVFLCFHLEIKAGIGNTVTNLQELSSSAVHAKQCLAYGELYDDEVVFNFKNYRESLPIETEADSSFKPLERIERNLMLLRHKEVVHSLNDWFQEDVSADSLRDFCNAYLLLLSKLAQIHGIGMWNSEVFFSLMQRVNSAPKKQIKNFLISATDSLFRLINEKRSARSLHENDIVAMAKKYVQENLTKPDLCFDDVCRHIGITKIYFGRLFQKEEGMSFGTYINQARVDLAKEILEQTNLHVFEVAEKVGFFNSKYFSVIFKTATGMTPLDYRRSKRFE